MIILYRSIDIRYLRLGYAWMGMRDEMKEANCVYYDEEWIGMNGWTGLFIWIVLQ
jgi:hypothetical protein